MSKKRKIQKFTKTSIRQKGFSDGYFGAKNAADSYIPKLVKQGVGKQEIVEMILEYNIGYKVGALACKDLNGIKVCNDKEFYKGNAISDSVSIDKDGILEHAQILKQKKRRRK